MKICAVAGLMRHHWKILGLLFLLVSLAANIFLLSRFSTGHTRSETATANQPDTTQPPRPGTLQGTPFVWHAFPPRPDSTPAGDDHELSRQLEAIGYRDGYMPNSGQSGVVDYDRDGSYNGLNFYTSGHAAEAILIDMSGNTLHRWHCDFRQVWPDKPIVTGKWNHQFWRRAHLCENGDVIAIFENLGLIKLDSESNVLWSYYGPFHHDLDVRPDGRIFVLTREWRRDEAYCTDHPILDDFICVLDETGRPQKRVSVLRCIENSDYAPVLHRLRDQSDILHTNTISVLDGTLASRSPAFREGNVLISIRELGLIGVIDMESESLVWSLSGLWAQQHEPSLLAGGTMLLFDNQGRGTRSRVLEFDPFSQEIRWSYSGTDEDPLYSSVLGSCDRLPNGNTLITESTAGRAFEVTESGRIVWNFFSPHRAGEDDQLIAALFDVVRLEPDFPLDWLKRIHPDGSGGHAATMK